MAEPMQLPQPKTFDQRADRADAQWSNDEIPVQKPRWRLISKPK